jgi:hypothetical protein
MINLQKKQKHNFLGNLSLLGNNHWDISSCMNKGKPCSWKASLIQHHTYCAKTHSNRMWSTVSSLPHTQQN